MNLGEISEPERKRRKGRRKARVAFSAVSVPLPVLEEIDKLIKELGYWPSRSAFVREACVEKIEREIERMEKLKEK
ncbi:ribbon-helix-helix protein, CopG family [Candidatus Bathyarchaeota archaeon]|nr:ribbon-helix-helix protein, CopG family [Candidatus Bathyarchaeota archaeon]